MKNPEIQKIMNDPEMMKKATEFLGTVGLDPAKVKEMLDSLEDEKSTNAAKNAAKVAPVNPAKDTPVNATSAGKKDSPASNPVVVKNATQALNTTVTEAAAAAAKEA